MIDNCGQPAPGRAACLSLVQPAPAPTPGQMRPNTTGPQYGFSPSDLASAYSIPASSTTATVAIVDAFGDPTVAADLAAYRSYYGLPDCTTANGCLSIVNDSGDASPLPWDGGTPGGGFYSNTVLLGWAQETALDVEMVSAACPTCHILLVEASDNGSSLDVGVATAVSLGAKYVSMSWGMSDDANSPLYDEAMNFPGVDLIAASGDNAYFGGADWPATDPRVVSVGGTHLARDAATTRGWTDTVWGNPDIGGGTASGCSAAEPQQPWQQGIAALTAVCAQRAANDVSIVGDPGTGVATFAPVSITTPSSAWAQMGGTSAGSPLIAALYAMAGTPSATNPASAYPYLHATGLTDVTGGANIDIDINATMANGGTVVSHPDCGTILCHAATGWDGPTGLGVPNGVSAFTAPAISSAVSIPAPGAVSSFLNKPVTFTSLGATDSKAGTALYYRLAPQPGVNGNLGLPTGVSMHADGSFTGTPTTLGDWHTAITVTDAQGASATTSFTWSVLPNLALGHIDDLTTVVNQAVDITIPITTDTTSLTISQSGLPDYSEIHSHSDSGSVIADIDGVAVNPGTYPVMITATNYAGITSTTSFTWTVLPWPTITWTNPGLTVNTVGDSVNLTVPATDSDTTDLTYAATGLPAGLHINPATGQITGTATTAALSSVSVTVTDVYGVVDTTTFYWRIDPAAGGGNGGSTTPPPVTSTAPSTVSLHAPGTYSSYVNTPASIALAASDSAHLPVSYSASGLPQGAVINPATGAISGTPTTTGTYRVAVTAAANDGVSVSAAIVWTINPNVFVPVSAAEFGGAVSHGTTVTASYGSVRTDSPSGAVAEPRAAYQWYLDGKTIPGATGATYKIPTAYAHHKLSYRVTLTATGFTARTILGPSAYIDGPHTFVTGKAKITGTVKHGKTVRVSYGTVRTDTAKGKTVKPHVTIQWYANGKAIKGATKTTLKIPAADKHRHLTYRLTLSASGYTTRTITSASATVR